MKEKYYPLSFSSLKEFAKSPAHFIAYKNKQKTDTAAMRFGTAVHSAVLEPQKFELEYLPTDLRRNTKAYKALVDDNPSKTFLTGSDWTAIKRIKSNIKGCQMAYDLLSGCNKIEQLVTGTIEGIEFRGFVDAMNTDYMIDFKTTQNGSPKEFGRSAFNFSYYLQAAIYRELTGVQDFWIVTAENQSPYTITPYILSEEYLERGRVELMSLISDFKAWNGEAIGYAGSEEHEFFVLNAPNWA